MYAGGGLGEYMMITVTMSIPDTTMLAKAETKDPQSLYHQQRTLHFLFSGCSPEDGHQFTSGCIHSDDKKRTGKTNSNELLKPPQKRPPRGKKAPCGLEGRKYITC